MASTDKTPLRPPGHESHASDPVDCWAKYAEEQEAEVVRLQQAVDETLKYMERVRGGDPSLTSEEYYIVRDFARRVRGG